MNNRLLRSLHEGFTLIELMVVVSLIAILASLAAPSFQKLATAQALRSASSDLHISLMQARSEALRTNRNVYVVATSATATATTADWSAGWRSFVDTNNSGFVYEPGTDTLISTAPAVSSKLTIDLARTTSVSFTFDARGFSSLAAANGKVTFAAADDGSTRKMVVVDRLGKARVCDYKTNPGCES